MNESELQRGFKNPIYSRFSKIYILIGDSLTLIMVVCVEAIGLVL